MLHQLVHDKRIVHLLRPLSMRSVTGNPSTSALLLDHHANPIIPDTHKHTPYFHAYMYTHTHRDIHTHTTLHTIHVEKFIGKPHHRSRGDWLVIIVYTLTYLRWKLIFLKLGRTRNYLLLLFCGQGYWREDLDISRDFILKDITLSEILFLFFKLMTFTLQYNKLYNVCREKQICLIISIN